MKKALLTAIAIISALYGISQTWCPPGATWTFKFHDNFMAEDGYTQVKNSGTVSVSGTVCTHLTVQRYGTKYNGTFPFTENRAPINTYENNGVVFYQTGPQRFDTIANFNANIGDGWYVPGWDSTILGPRIKIQVFDTGHVTINGQYLRRLTISSSSLVAQYNLYIIEKIGPLNGFLHGQYCHHLDCWNQLGDFRCYKDDNFAVYSKPGYTDCNFVSISEEAQDLEKIKIFPNPNNGSFTIKTREPAIVRIFDQPGSLVYEARIENEGEHSIDATALAPGLYILNAESKGVTTSFKFLRE